jgi:transposase
MMVRLKSDQGQLFYEFHLGDAIPEDHLVRKIDAGLDLSWLRGELAPHCSSMGRPSIDPELIIRMLIVGYVFAIRSERLICREVQVNRAYRWFCKLGIEDAIPDHSAFSRARNERFREGEVFRRVFERVVEACIAAEPLHRRSQSLSQHGNHRGDISRHRIDGRGPRLASQVRSSLFWCRRARKDAMGAANEGPRKLLISTGKVETSGVLVAVQDSGPGLEAAMLERVFESFYTTKPTGLGLGLSICRSIIEAHGGRLWASTSQRRGATFQFTLPGDANIPS